MEEREMIGIEETTGEMEEANERSGMSTTKAFLFGAGIGLAVTALVKFTRKKIAEHRANKEASKAIVVEPEDYCDVETSESTEEETK